MSQHLKAKWGRVLVVILRVLSSTELLVLVLASHPHYGSILLKFDRFLVKFPQFTTEIY